MCTQIFMIIFIFYADHSRYIFLALSAVFIHYIPSEIWQLMFPLLFCLFFADFFRQSTLVLVSVHPLLIMNSETEVETEAEANRKKKNSAEYTYRQSIENSFSHTHTHIHRWRVGG